MTPLPPIDPADGLVLEPVRQLAAPTVRCVSVCVPAHDEEATVGDVVAAARAGLSVLGVPGEVVVVASGCSDGTAAVAERAGARVVSSPAGKGIALERAFAAARGELVCLVDGDVVYLGEEPLVALLCRPILEGRAEAVIADMHWRPVYPRLWLLGFWAPLLGYLAPEVLTKFGGSPWSGQRASLARLAPAALPAGFTCDTALNLHWHDTGARIGTVATDDWVNPQRPKPTLMAEELEVVLAWAHRRRLGVAATESGCAALRAWHEDVTAFMARYRFGEDDVASFEQALSEHAREALVRHLVRVAPVGGEVVDSRSPRFEGLATVLEEVVAMSRGSLLTPDEFHCSFDFGDGSYCGNPKGCRLPHVSGSSAAGAPGGASAVRVFDAPPPLDKWATTDEEFEIEAAELVAKDKRGRAARVLAATRGLGADNDDVLTMMRSPERFLSVLVSASTNEVVLDTFASASEAAEDVDDDGSWGVPMALHDLDSGEVHTPRRTTSWGGVPLDEQQAVGAAAGALQVLGKPEWNGSDTVDELIEALTIQGFEVDGAEYPFPTTRRSPVTTGPDASREERRRALLASRTIPDKGASGDVPRYLLEERDLATDKWTFRSFATPAEAAAAHDAGEDAFGRVALGLHDLDTGVMHLPIRTTSWSGVNDVDVADVPAFSDELVRVLGKRGSSGDLMEWAAEVATKHGYKV